MMITSTPKFARACAESFGVSLHGDRQAMIPAADRGLYRNLGSGVT